MSPLRRTGCITLKLPRLKTCRHPNEAKTGALDLALKPTLQTVFWTFNLRYMLIGPHRALSFKQEIWQKNSIFGAGTQMRPEQVH